MSAAGQRVQVRVPSGRISAEFVDFPGEAAAALERELRSGLSCEVDFGPQARALFATDASNYRQVPIGVVTPKSRDDVIEAVRMCRAQGAPIVARGGGTSLAGQGCNVAVLIDFSKHLTRVLEIDPERRLARVEPGCILDDLRNAAEVHHLTFGPDPATHGHNTIGGMVGNNSCGAHSVMSGRTSDYVERLTILTYDGTILDVGPTPDTELQALLRESGRRGDIYRRLCGLRDRFGALIEEKYPRIPRRVSGFENLDTLLPGRDFNVAQTLVGTEGTCALVLEAVLRLVPSPPCRALCLLGFEDVCAAADAVPNILRYDPIALEGFDNLLYGFIEKGNVEGAGLRFLPEGKGWLIVEVGADSLVEASARACRIAEAHRSAAVVTDPEDQRLVWLTRESALGATAFVPGEDATWEGWEDAAVAPEKLGDYLRAFRALLAKHGYRTAMYGHFGDGLIHCRIDFDLGSEKGIARFRAFVEEAAHLVVRHGGSLSGEHGDGEARAELLEIMYGPDLVRGFREFKAIWDPDNRLNPGKAIDPFPLDSNLRLGPDYDPPKVETYFRYNRDRNSFAHATMRCVGVGKCRRRQVGNEVMCPSYLVTNEEKHSTRGRAHLLHEMLRGEVIRDGWHSEEVEDALSLCLACKGCRSDCPVGVDVATYKAEFRAHHYHGRLRPLAAYSLGWIDRWTRLAEPLPGLANLAVRIPGATRLAGIDPRAHLPRFRPTFRRWFRRRGGRGQGERILLWPDTFNNHFRPEVAIAATRLLEAAGFAVAIPDRPLCCGRALYDWGFIERAKKLWERTFACLGEDIEAGVPVVGLEPACTSAFKDELPNLFGDRPAARALSQNMVHFTDFVASRLDRFPDPRRGGRALVQAHCHHHAVLGFGAEEKLLEHLGQEVERPDQGCCGMAGAFGLAAETYETGRAIGELALLPRIRELPDDALIVADGFSCRQLIEETGRRPLHMAELLAERML